MGKPVRFELWKAVFFHPFPAGFREPKLMCSKQDGLDSRQSKGRSDPVSFSASPAVCENCGLPIDEKGWHTVRDKNHPVHVGDRIRIGKRKFIEIVE